MSTTPGAAGRPEAVDPAARDASRGSGGTAVGQRPGEQPSPTDAPAAVPGVPSDTLAPNDPARGDPATRAQNRPDVGPAGVPNVDPNIAAGGGRARLGATGKTMSECMAAWDAETHLSKDKWRETCQRTLTEPHL
jgi:hypothetical protein